MNRELSSKIWKFIVVGGLSTLINYGLFFLLINYLKSNYIFASVAGYIAGLIIGFILNNFWTFEHKSLHTQKTIGYAVVYLVSLGISTLFLWIAVDKFEFNKYWMNLFAIGISTVMNFIGLNFLIYRNARR